MRRFFTLIFFGFVWTASAAALDIPAKPEAYVNDYAHLLSDAARLKLEQTLADFERSTSNQVVVATFRSLEGESLEDTSIRLARAWKIGSKKNDNGVILLIFKEDRKIRIEVGYGLEGALPDVIADQIIRREITPAFREGDYDKGITSAVDAILLATRGEYLVDPRMTDEKEQKIASYIFFAMVLFFVLRFFSYAMVFVGSIMFFGFPMGFLTALLIVLMLEALHQAMTRAAFGQTLSSRTGGGFWGGGFGGGGFSGGGFSGGFGGGGGGSFGGGGASGGW